MVDKKYCMSSYLMYRYIFNREKTFLDKMPCYLVDISFPRTPVKNAMDLLQTIEKQMQIICEKTDAVLALSGGMDSAILAKFMPKGAKAYTFRCVVPGKQVIDESPQAKVWADINQLDHQVISIYWEDIERAAEQLMLQKGEPIHSIEAQIYLAAQRVKKDGAKTFIFGENADIIYGGMDGLLKKNWLFGEFVDRYSYIKPYYVLYEPEWIIEPFLEFQKDGYIDAYHFINKYFRQEALGTYYHACEMAKVTLAVPYAFTYFDRPIDYTRIRNGETKYIIREAFQILYPNRKIPEKIPMPRPMNEWFENWKGPSRPEFLPHAVDKLSGDQRWMVWALERFLNIIDQR